MSARTTRRLTYMPWMDGMRAFAVLAVMASHEVIGQLKLGKYGLISSLGIDNWVDGGGLGVDVFFAISGFLITALLLQEAYGKGRIGFKQFYIRRARRLFPALAAVLVVIAGSAILADHGHARIHTLKQVAATAFYAANWVSAMTHFDMRLLNHTWSLATEEQFYAVWPLMITGLVLLSRRWKPAILAGVLAITVAAIAWTQFAISRHWSQNRIYYALDTRAAGLAIGALLGVLWVSDLLPKHEVWVWIRRLAALAGLFFIAFVMHHSYELIHFHLRLFRAEQSDYMVVALGTTLIIWELIESPRHFGHAILGWKPLVAIGRISYGLYLWDAVVVIALTPHEVGVSGWPLVAIHIAVTFAIAIASWYGVERWFRVKRQAPVSPTAPATPRAAV